MKILVLYQSSWWNAAAYYTYNLVKSLNRIGYEIIFTCKKDTPIATKIINDRYKIININLFENNPLKFFGNIKKVKQLIIDDKIDYLIPISAPGHIITGLIKKVFNIQLPIIKVCLDNMAPTNNILNKYLHNSLTDYFIFPGESTKIKYKFFLIDKYSIIHAPININQFTDFKSDIDLKEHFQIPKNKIIVSFIGRFSPEKGIFFLLDIISTVLSKTDKAFFILSGSEEQIKFKDVQNKIDELKITSNVKIINKVDDVRALISITDIGLLSSRISEYICRIAMEFMSFKKPIVAPNVNVIPEVVGSIDNGFIYNLNDFNEAADHLLKLINDKELLSKMGLNSFEIMKNNYDDSIFDSKIKSILENIR